MFRVFVGFYLCIEVSLQCVTVPVVLSFLEYLVSEKVSVSMINKYVSAIKAIMCTYGLQIQSLDNHQIRYFIKSLRINRPLTVNRKYVISLSTLKKII